MPKETDMQRILREYREEQEKAKAKPATPKKPKGKKPPKNLRDKIRGRGDAIDQAVEDAVGALKKRQQKDSDYGGLV
jgi:hypothetical protein